MVSARTGEIITKSSELQMIRRPSYNKHQNILLTLSDMAVFEVEEVDNAALQCTALCSCVVTVNTKCL